MNEALNSSSPLRALQRAVRFLLVELWTAGADGATRFQRALVASVRVGFITLEGFVNDLCMLRASALTFASLMALVPTLALAFAVLRGLGWHGDRLEELILGKATLLSADAIKLIVSYIDNTSFAGLGVLGGSILFLTFVSVMTNIEASFNAIWGGVSHRPMVRRVFDYFGVMIVAPVLLAVTMSLTAAMQSNGALQWIGETWAVGSALRYTLSYGSYVVVWILFAFLYTFVPNTRVRMVAALIGGIVAGSIWHFTQFLYIRFQIGMGSYNAIYGAMAQLPLLMAWIYISWIIVLFGAEISYAVQNLHSYSRERRASGHSGQALREYAGLGIVGRLAAAADGRRQPPTVEELALAADLPTRLIRDLIEELAAAGLVHVSSEAPERCFLSKAPERIRVAEVLDLLRGSFRPAASDDGDAAIKRVLGQVRGARDQALAERTLKDLAADSDDQ